MALGAIALTNWFLALTPPAVVALAIALLLYKRSELRSYATAHRELREARERGSHQARLQHPSIDLEQCIGCGLCVKACPEDGVLSLLHGQAVVIHGARCVGHGRCAEACPVGAIAITLGDLSARDDLPALNGNFEAVNVPGLFLAGEISGFALVRTAIGQGVAVADAVAQRHRPYGSAGTGDPKGGDTLLDLLIVGAGPGGMACALRAKEHGLNFSVIDQADQIGGTVATYPRRKMVMTQPVTLPLYGRLPRLTYQKEELVDIWEQLARDKVLPIETGVQLTGLDRNERGHFVARTSAGPLVARQVCLALGRRGTPRKLNVPGEDLPKVAYSLLDAESYRGRRVLVVGGGDSAIEAALGLAAQDGNEVLIAYRKQAFFRLKARNEARLSKALEAGRLRVRFETEVESIGEQEVRLRNGSNGAVQIDVIPNDDVFIFAGGDPPFRLLSEAGVSFDSKDRPPAEEIIAKGQGLLIALLLTLLCSVGLGALALWYRGYYVLDINLRPASALHALLRPAGPVGLAAGLAACALILCNLAYLARRSLRFGSRIPGKLSTWMVAHVCTGLLAYLCILAHAGFTMRAAAGGHAFIVLSIVVVSGAIGRYLYAFVPRAANGSELDLEDVRKRLTDVSGLWDRDGRGFGTHVRDEIEQLITAGRWRPSLPARIWALLRGHVRLRRTLSRLRAEGERESIPADEVERMLALARRAYWLTLVVTHFEEIRAVLSSWRFIHRWLALLMVLLAAVHIVAAARYAQFDWPDVPAWLGVGR